MYQSPALDANDFTYLYGKEMSADLKETLAKYPGVDYLRVIVEGNVYTQDIRINRLNINIDTNKKVKGVWVG